MGKKLKLDFTGVESFNRASEGQHVVKIASAEIKQSQGGNDMIVIAFEVTKGEDKGARVYENYPLIETALWKLKGLLQAIGMKCDGKVQVDLDKLIGRALIIEVRHEEYEGKVRARVDEMKKLSVTTSSDDDEDEDEDFDEDDEIEADEDEEEEKPAKKSKKATAKKEEKKPAKKGKKQPEPEDEDDWDDEEEEKPVKKSTKKQTKKPEKEKATKKVEPEDDDDDDDWDEDDE